MIGRARQANNSIFFCQVTISVFFQENYSGVATIHCWWEEKIAGSVGTITLYNLAFRVVSTLAIEHSRRLKALMAYAVLQQLEHDLFGRL